MPGIKIITYRPRISNPPLPRMFGPPRPPPRKPRLGGPSIFDGLVPNRNSIKRYKITHNEVKNRDLTKRNKYNLLKLMKGAKQHCPAPASNPQERQNFIQSNQIKWLTDARMTASMASPEPDPSYIIQTDHRQ